MTREEFEKLTLRGNAHISQPLYDSIEKSYIADDIYHRHVSPAGADESKEDFERR